MNAAARLGVMGVMACALAACSSSSNPPTCSFSDPATLAVSSWPKFRHDRQNTGRIDGVDLSTNPRTLRWVFPAAPDRKGAFEASPVLSTGDKLIYIGSTDGALYVLNTGPTCGQAGTLQTEFVITAEFGITSTALLALRDGKDAIFVGGGNGFLYALNDQGNAQPNYWPFAMGGFVSASPNFSVSNGIVYAASLQGFVSGVCPNGIAKYGASTIGTASSPAVGPDGSVYVGADDAQLRAADSNGVFRWTFSASAPITGAPVVEVGTNGSTVAVYVADLGGRVFKVDPHGLPFQQPAFDFVGQNGGPVGPIQSSPALVPAVKHLYFGAEDGNVYAVNTDSGKIDWIVPTGGAVVSSPAVATGGAQPTVVVGSDDGSVYFIEDDGSASPPSRQFSIPSGAAVRSSPAIDAQGTVYVGADDGHVYAIGATCAPSSAG